MASLVTLTLAKLQLRITDSDHDTDVQSKADQASAIIVDYLKAKADPDWTDATVPLPVQAAILLVLTHLYEHRGDDQETDESLWLAIERLLIRYRDPAFA